MSNEKESDNRMGHADYLFDEAKATAQELLEQAVCSVRSELKCRGNPKDHPEVVAAYMNSTTNYFAGSMLAKSLDNLTDAIRELAKQSAP